MNTKTDAYLGNYQGEKAVWLKADHYEAVLLPEIGGNLIAFRDTEKNYRILREPAENEMETFKANPGVYGIPVLFPPNRYEDGKFPWNGRELDFPVNEERTSNHLHGFLHTAAWNVDQMGVNGEESFVVVSLTVDEQHPIYRYLPFSFVFQLRYTLHPQLGLSQHVLIRNKGEETMPCLLAFHTAVNAPFAPDSTSKDCKVKLTIGERWELSDRMLPTGRYQELTLEEVLLRDGGVYPFFASLDNHYTAKPQGGRNRMELTDTKAGVTLVYDVGTSYKQWMIWNNGGAEGFFCPEPQMNLVNAPKVDLPADEIGLIGLAPGEIFEETSRLYLIG
ncbi:aldose 1-epimerase [Gorillibacterium timonense]|uniref:aldose 1-epimerase n=1 Tax=Gorillibacterium timonense TaxID=1689269 RepID=UPI00071C5CEC|nr:aldose 1-epimerase [Gorillibacterium timonense]